MAPPNGKAALKVTTQSTNSEVGVQTLVGDYAERGQNHSRKTYQKLQKIPGHEDMQVWLYYWDARDGADFSGWWFGSEVGGAQVWARCPSHGPSPPKAGWKIPWDAPRAEPGMLSVDPVGVVPPPNRPAAAAAGAAGVAAPVRVAAGVAAGVPAAGAAGAAGVAGKNAAAALLKKSTEQVAEAEGRAAAVLAAAKTKFANEEATPEELQEVQAALSEEAKMLQELQNSLTKDINEARKGGPLAMPSVTEMSKLSPKIRSMQANVTADLNKCKSLVIKAKNSGPALAARKEEQRKLEERDLKEVNEAVPLAYENVTSAEDAVEGVVQMATPLLEDPPEDQSASFESMLQEIETSAAEAQTKVGEARTHINQKLQGARKYAPEARKVALEEFGALQAKLTAAQQKVTPYKTFKKDFRVRVEARKALADVAAKVSALDEEVEKVATEGAPSDDSGLSDEEVKRLDGLIAPVQKGLLDIGRQIDQKSRTADAAAKGEFASLKSKLDAANQKLGKFKAEVEERKVAALVEAVKVVVDTAEAKLQELKEAAEAYSAEDVIASPSEATIKAGEKALEADKETATALLGAKTVLGVKQRDAKTQEGKSAFMKFHTKISAMQGEHAKLKATITSNAKVIKSKQTLKEEEDRLNQLDVDFSKLEGFAGEAELAEGAVKEMNETIASAEASIKASIKACEVSSSVATADMKAIFTKMIERAKQLQAKIVKIKTDTKDVREKVMADMYVNDGKKRAEAVEAGLQKMTTVELPFLKGLEVIPWKEATDTVKACEEVATEVQATINDARNFVAAKNLEVRNFKKEITDSAKAEFTSINEQINAAAKQLSQFKRETDERKKTAQLQEAGERMDEVDAKVTAALELAEPFLKKEDPEDLEAESSAPKLEALAAAEKEALAKLGDMRTMLAACRTGAVAGPAKEALPKLQVRLTEAQASVSKASRVVSNNDKLLLAKKVLAEAAEMVEGAEAEVKKAHEACAPLLEQGGVEFLVFASIRTLVAALEAHMKAAEMTEDKLFQEATGNTGIEQMSEAAFVKFLESLPGELKKDELTFSDERRKAIFKAIDVDKDDKVGPEDFSSMFRKKYVCVKPTTITDTFEVSKGQTVGKLEPGDEVEAKGPPKKDPVGLLRFECKALSSDAAGWATMSGNNKQDFLELYSPFKAFSKELDKKLVERAGAIQKVATYVKDQNTKLTGPGKMADARAKLVELQPRVVAAHKELEELKRKVAMGKQAYLKTEQKEKVAHIEAKEKKAADEVLGPVTEKMASMESSVEELEKVAQPLTSLAEAEYKTFAKPASTLTDSEKLHATAAEKIKDLKESLREQQKAAAGVNSSSMAEAKRTLIKMASKCEAAARSSTTTLEAVKKACASIVDSRALEAQAALRDDVIKRGVTAEDVFFELSGGEDRLTEEALCKRLMSLEGLEFTEEQSQLLCRHIEVGGIGKRRFMGFVQQYLVVVKDIAVTTGLDIGAGKTIRKADLEEVMEVQEGPRADPHLGLKRVKGKMLRDGVEGWISLRGNQGTPFLKDVEKPYFVVLQSVPIDKDISSEGQDAIRNVEAEEVLELIEGPRKEPMPAAVRLRGKAVKDGATGWISAKDKRGVVFAEPSDKYMSCVAAVAMTDSQDLKECNVVRKLALGEIVTVTEGPVTDEDAKVVRAKCTALKDKAEGWITVKGNAGTVYAEAAGKFHTIVKPTPVQKRFNTDGAESIRELEEGEVFQMLESKEEKSQPETRIKVCALQDGTIGWVTLKPKVVKAWTPFYKCLIEVPMHDQRALEGATVARDVDKGEIIELLDGPSWEDEVLRMKGRADKDGIVGWVSIKEKAGKTFLTS